VVTFKRIAVGIITDFSGFTRTPFSLPTYRSEKAKKSSHLICQEKYDEIVALLRTKHQKKEPACLLKYRSTYSLCGNVEGHCLYWNWNGKLTVVPKIENVFDIILEAHAKGGHPKGNNIHLSEK
jgi:hypothetical protein